MRALRDTAEPSAVDALLALAVAIQRVDATPEQARDLLRNALRISDGGAVTVKKAAKQMGCSEDHLRQTLKGLFPECFHQEGPRRTLMVHVPALERRMFPEADL